MAAWDEENDMMLCEDILPLVEFKSKIAIMDPVIVAGNFQQKPFDRKGLLYGTFKTYLGTELPLTGRRRNYTDTADEGTDYLCSINYIEVSGLMYVIDVIYTQDPMERTELSVSKMLAEDHVEHARIESNNGGRGFARAVEKNVLDPAIVGTPWPNCRVEWFWQGANKWSRITTNSTAVTNTVIMPVDWAARWPMFYREVTSVQHGKPPKHDDAEDTLTGMVESSLLASAPVMLFS
jgi:predicted phage terminase large subunit-like protein